MEVSSKATWEELMAARLRIRELTEQLEAEVERLKASNLEAHIRAENAEAALKANEKAASGG